MLTTDMFKGEAQRSITFRNEVGGDALFQKVKDLLIEEIRYQNIPAEFTETMVRSGGMVFGTKLPALVVSHPNHRGDYFSICFVVNGNTVSFPVTGESVENTKRNKKEYYERTGQYFKAALIKPDEFKLQQEDEWEMMILSCFNNHTNN